jgi:hypothetical protein
MYYLSIAAACIAALSFICSFLLKGFILEDFNKSSSQEFVEEEVKAEELDIIQHEKGIYPTSK